MTKHIYQLHEVLGDLKKDGLFEQVIACFHLYPEDSLLDRTDPTYSDGFSISLVVSGRAVLQINYKEYTVVQGDVVLFSPFHLLKFESVENFSTTSLMIKKTFFDELPMMINTHRPLYASLMGINNPVNHLDPEDFEVLNGAMLNIRAKILHQGHSLKREVIKTALAAFILDFDHVMSKRTVQSQTLTRQDLLLRSFLELLSENYKEKHEISYYTELLHVTPQYLSLVVKNITGHTASQLIYEMLLSEARILLHQPHLTIQQIAEQLQFSDQSAFGKFFSRRSGMSPLQFRRLLQ